MRHSLVIVKQGIEIVTYNHTPYVRSYKNADGKRIPTNGIQSPSDGSHRYMFWVTGPYVHGTLANAFLWAHAIDETAVIGDVLLAFEHITEVELLESLSILSALGYSHVPAEQK